MIALCEGNQEKNVGSARSQAKKKERSKILILAIINHREQMQLGCN